MQFDNYTIFYLRIKKKLLCRAMALLSLQQLAAQAIVILQKPKEEVALPADFNPIEIFLAGTIDMGKSIDWQVAMSAQFAEEVQRSVSFL